MEGDKISTEDSPGSDPFPVIFRDRDLTWPNVVGGLKDCYRESCSKEHDLERGLVLLEPRELI